MTNTSHFLVVLCGVLPLWDAEAILPSLNSFWALNTEERSPLRSWLLSSHEHGTAMLMGRLLVKLLCMAGLFFETPR